MARKKDKKIPVYFEISEMISLEGLIRSKINGLDELIRTKKAMFEQKEALRNRIRFFDALNTRMYQARTGENLENALTSDQQKLVDWMMKDKDSEPILVISNMYEFGQKRWFANIEKDTKLQSIFDEMYTDNLLMSKVLHYYLYLREQDEYNKRKDEKEKQKKEKNNRKMQMGNKAV